MIPSGYMLKIKVTEPGIEGVDDLWVMMNCGDDDLVSHDISFKAFEVISDIRYVACTQSPVKC